MTPHRMTIQWLRQLATVLSPWILGFDPKPVHMGFVVEKMVLGYVFLRVLWFSPITVLPMLRTHLSITSGI
jgi:hypothetical protein